MRRETAQRLGLRTTSDLAAAINAGMDITLGCNAEFYGRKDGLMPMQDAYGRKFPRRTIARMDSGLIYQALRDGQVDAGLVFSTDGRVPAFDFVLLEDDRTYHIPQVMTPGATKEVLAAHPEVEALLKGISGRLDSAGMARLNAQAGALAKRPDDRTFVSLGQPRAAAQDHGIGPGDHILDAFGGKRQAVRCDGRSAVDAAGAPFKGGSAEQAICDPDRLDCRTRAHHRKVRHEQEREAKRLVSGIGQKRAARLGPVRPRAVETSRFGPPAPGQALAVAPQIEKMSSATPATVRFGPLTTMRPALPKSRTTPEAVFDMWSRMNAAGLSSSSASPISRRSTPR